MSEARVQICKPDGLTPDGARPQAIYHSSANLQQRYDYRCFLYITILGVVHIGFLSGNSAPGSGTWTDAKFELGNYGIWFCGRTNSTGKVQLWLKVKLGAESDWTIWKLMYQEE